MERVDRLHRESSRSHTSKFGWPISLTLFCLALAILVVTLIATRLHSIDLSSMLLGIALATFCVVLFFLSRSLLLLREQQQETASALDTTEASLLESEERFRQMANNIQEIFWMIDAETRKTLYVNPAYETITGRSRAALKEDPLSYEEIIHPDDRVHVLLKLEEATQTGDFDERFRIVSPSGEARWVVKYPLTLSATEFPLLQRVLLSQSGLVLSDTKQEQQWRTIKGSSHLRSWLCVPLVASHQTLGLLSLGHSEPDSFTQEHLRLAKSLAIPAAAAIQNARLYECAKIYGAELEKRTSDLEEAQSALQRFQSGRPS